MKYLYGSENLFIATKGFSLGKPLYEKLPTTHLILFKKMFNSTREIRRQNIWRKKEELIKMRKVCYYRKLSKLLHRSNEHLEHSLIKQNFSKKSIENEN